MWRGGEAFEQGGQFGRQQQRVRSGPQDASVGADVELVGGEVADPLDRQAE